MNLRELNDGRIFGAVFVKRSDGLLRRMRCRTGVTRYLKGGEKKFDDSKRNLLTVWDVDKQAYRSIPIDRIVELRHHGKVEAGPLFGGVNNE